MRRTPPGLKVEHMAQYHPGPIAKFLLDVRTNHWQVTRAKIKTRLDSAALDHAKPPMSDHVKNRVARALSYHITYYIVRSDNKTEIQEHDVWRAMSVTQSEAADIEKTIGTFKFPKVRKYHRPSMLFSGSESNLCAISQGVESPNRPGKGYSPKMNLREFNQQWAL